MHIAGNYAYVANETRSGQLQIIDIQTNNPVLISTYQISSVTGSGAQALGHSIFYKDGFVYLGLTKTNTGPEFHIIDVSDPNTPLPKGTFAIGNDINSIYVRGDYAFIASPNNEELKILNISDKNNLYQVSFLDLTDNSANGKSIAIVGNSLYLGRTVGASPSTKELEIFDIEDTNNPSSLGLSMDIDSTVNALAVRDNLIFLLTSDTNRGFQIWDLNNLSLYGFKNVQQTSTGGMDCEGNYIYIAQRSNKALQIVGPGP